MDEGLTATPKPSDFLTLAEDVDKEEVGSNRVSELSLPPPPPVPPIPQNVLDYVKSKNQMVKSGNQGEKRVHKIALQSRMKTERNKNIGYEDCVFQINLKYYIIKRSD